MKYYCLGFLFSRSLDWVLLIEKKRPKWQAGKFNGVGGKIEPNETKQEAMIREFQEEAGLKITDWTAFARMSGPDWTVDCFCAKSDLFDRAKSKTDEEIVFIQLPIRPEYAVIPNLQWLIPMALETITGSSCLNADIRYEY